jgi:hypothetical protein
LVVDDTFTRTPSDSRMSTLVAVGATFDSARVSGVTTV